MNDDDRNRKGRMDIPGERVKPWAVWRVSSNGSQIEKVAEADTSEELRYKRRQNWRYKTYHYGKPVRLAPPRLARIGTTLKPICAGAETLARSNLQGRSLRVDRVTALSVSYRDD